MASEKGKGGAQSENIRPKAGRGKEVETIKRFIHSKTADVNGWRYGMGIRKENIVKKTIVCGEAMGKKEIIDDEDTCV